MNKLTILLLLVPFLSFSQSKIDYGRSYADTLPQEFQLELSSLRGHIYKGIAEETKTEHEKSSFVFADMAAYAVIDMIADGDVYYDWKVFENYLNEILQKVIPEELENDTVIHAYLVKNGQFNASMMPSGHTFVNIGIFADVQDEASIAGIFAHELAHYYKQHSLKRYIANKTGKLKSGWGSKNYAQVNYNVRQELEADSLAMVWLNNSGYHINGLKQTFAIMERYEKNRISTMKDEWEVEETTHPEALKRAKLFAAFLSESGRNPGADFLVDEQLFHQLKEQSKPEILKHLLYDFNYNTCIERAFKFHMFKPNDPTYLYYLMESIRRLCYLDVELWQKNFITHRYYDTIMVTGHRMKREREDHLFVTFDEQLLNIDSVDRKLLMANFYWEKPKFVSNEGAFEFFYRVSQVVKNNECILSNALSLSTNKRERNKLLNLYLSKDDIEHRDFAALLLKDSLEHQLSKNKLMVFSEFASSIKIGKDIIPIVSGGCASDPLHCMFDSISADFENCKPLYLPDYKMSKLNEHALLRELEDFSMTLTISRGAKTELHILDPRFWEVMRRYDVNEINFINCMFVESINSLDDKKDFEPLVDLKTNDLLKRAKSVRYLETYITSVRDMENSLMKIRYYSDRKLKFKKPAQGQLASLIKTSIARKEKQAETQDLDYRNTY